MVGALFRDGPGHGHRPARSPLAVLVLLGVAAVAGLGVWELVDDEDAFELADRYGADGLRPAAERAVAEEMGALVGDAQPLLDRTHDICLVDPETDTGDLFWNDSEGSLRCLVGATVVLPLPADDDAGATAATQRVLGDRCEVVPAGIGAGSRSCRGSLWYGLHPLDDPAGREELELQLSSTPAGALAEPVDLGDLLAQAAARDAGFALVLEYSDTYLEVDLDCPPAPRC
ncbi:hypothetical protein [Geodermatophilus sp. SYSU D00079]